VGHDQASRYGGSGRSGGPDGEWWFEDHHHPGRNWEGDSGDG